MQKNKTPQRGDEPHENPIHDILNPGNLPLGEGSQEKYNTDRKNDPKYIKKKQKQKLTFGDYLNIWIAKLKPWVNQGIELATKYVPMPVWVKLVLASFNKLQKKGFKMKDPKNTISNWVGIVVLIGGAIQTYLGTLDGNPINWLNLGMAVAVAVIAYFTGKSKDIKAKV